MKTRKIAALWLVAIVILSLAAPLIACSGAGPYSEGNGELNVVCTNFPPFDLARVVGGEKVTVTLLQDRGADLHNYSPTSSAIMAIKNADVFICVGGTSDELWLPSALSSAENTDLTVIKLTEHADLLPVPNVISEDGHEHGDEEGEEHSEDCEHDHSHDEHVWTSLRNTAKAVIAIAEAFSEKDAANSEYYKTNAADYATKLAALDAEYVKAVSEAKRKSVLFADRFPFVYMAKDYGLEYQAAFSGCSTEVNASFETTTRLVNAVKDGNLPYILITDADPTNAPAVAASVASSTGATILSMDSCQSITRSRIKSGVTYLDIMTQNLNVLKEALSE